MYNCRVDISAYFQLTENLFPALYKSRNRRVWEILNHSQLLANCNPAFGIDKKYSWLSGSLKS